jgi:muramoyltetrapeptide carboxypeptidase
VPEGGVERAVERVAALGWEAVPGRHCRARSGFLAGTDDERAADLSAALADPGVDAIWLLRGGYGTLRIVDRLPWDALAARPKPLIGFSDNTALHLAALRAGVVSFHGPHPHAPAFPDFSRGALLRVVSDPAPAGALPPTPGMSVETVEGGAAEGILVGGNLALVAATLGTPWAPRGDGAILFLEEVGEHAYRLDRLLTQLRLSGLLSRVAGVAVGQVTDTPAGGEGEPGAAEVLRERLSGLGVPVAVGFPFGHVDESWTLPLGVRARLDASAGSLSLVEGAVS